MAKICITEVGKQKEFLLEFKNLEDPKESLKFLKVFPKGGDELKVVLRDPLFEEDFEVGFYLGFEKYAREYSSKDMLDKEKYLTLLFYLIKEEVLTKVIAAEEKMSQLLASYLSLRI